MSEPISPLAEEKAKEIEPVKLSPEEIRYMGNVMSRLFRAKMENDAVRPELGNKTRFQYYSMNERIANTLIEKKDGDNDILVSSGTVEQKLFAVAAEINRLNLTAQVRPFDSEDVELVELGTALTDIVLKTEELEGDAENKLLRQVELFKQGTVFIQENWVTEYRMKKELDKEFTGNVEDVKITASQEKCYVGPRRQILYGPGVYLGSMREFQMCRQPFIFTHKHTSYWEAKSRYEKWGRWKHVPMNKVTLVTEDNLSSVNASSGWSLAEVQKESVEEIHYQDKYNNEYQIFLNGVPMLPVGFPLTAISHSGEYNIEKQVFQAVNPFFPLGRSFVAKTTNLSDLLDEMLRLLILKTRKSIHPPYANLSGRVISSKALMPGRITMGIDPGALVAIGQEGQGATAAEYQMLKTLQDNVDKVTVSPQFQGQQGKSGTTAYEVGVLAQQAEKILSLTVFAASCLEQKIAYLRLFNILGNYFQPVDQVVIDEATGDEGDETKQKLIDRYRQSSRSTNIEGRGKGVRRVIPTTQSLPDPKAIYNEEEYDDTPDPESGMRRRTRSELGMPALEKIYLNPDQLKLVKLTYFVEVDSKLKDTSDNAKSAFREQLQDIQALMALGSRPKPMELENEYSRVWGKKRERLFEDALPAAVGLPGEGQDEEALGRVLDSNRAGASTAAAPVA